MVFRPYSVLFVAISYFLSLLQLNAPLLRPPLPLSLPPPEFDNLLLQSSARLKSLWACLICLAVEEELELDLKKGDVRMRCTFLPGF